MKNKNLILKIVTILIILTSASLNIYQRREIKKLNSEIDYCDSEKSDLENSISELNDELEECKSDKEDSDDESSNRLSNNYYLESEKSNLESDKYDLESKIRNLEDELEDCQDKLRDCN